MKTYVFVLISLSCILCSCGQSQEAVSGINENPGPLIAVCETANMGVSIPDIPSEEIPPPYREVTSSLSGSKSVLLFDDATHSGIIITYPAIWGSAHDTSRNLAGYGLNFSNLINHGENGKPDIDTINYKDVKFRVNIVGFTDIINHHKNFEPGGESLTFDISFVDNLEQKLMKADKNCSGDLTLWGGKKCWDSNMVDVGNIRYFVYNTTYNAGECLTNRNWIGLVGDKVVHVSMILDTFAKDINQSSALCQSISGKNLDEKKVVTLSDFSINENKVQSAETSVMEFLKSLDIGNLSSLEDMNKEYDTLREYRISLERK